MKRFKILAAFLAFIILFVVTFGCTSPEAVTPTIIAIPDENLEIELRKYLHPTPVDDITADKMAFLQSLTLTDNNITNLSGLEYCINMTRLIIYRTQISDISALSALTELTYLYLNENQINDITSLSVMTQLEKLYLSENQINDISPVADLTNLTKLYLNDNQIYDVSNLAFLTKLAILNILQAVPGQ